MYQPLIGWRFRRQVERRDCGLQVDLAHARRGLLSRTVADVDAKLAAEPQLGPRVEQAVRAQQLQRRRSRAGEVAVRRLPVGVRHHRLPLERRGVRLRRPGGEAHRYQNNKAAGGLRGGPPVVCEVVCGIRTRITKGGRVRRTTLVLVTATVVSLSVGVMLALPTNTQFELDGNALVDVAPLTIGRTRFHRHPAWAARPSPVRSWLMAAATPPSSRLAAARTPTTSASGQWKDQLGGLPDKDNLTNAYAAVYTNVNGDLTFLLRGGPLRQ